MIASPSPIISDARGQAGSVVFKTIHGNIQIRKTYQRFKTYPIYAAQQKWNFEATTKTWRFLRDYQRKGWNDLALELGLSKPKFFKKPLDGFNLFVCLNLNSLRWNYNLNADAPDISVFNLPHVSISNNGSIMHTEYISFNLNGAYEAYIELIASKPHSAGCSFAQTFRYVTNQVFLDSLSYDISIYYANVFSTHANSPPKHFWKFRVIDRLSGAFSLWTPFNNDVSF